MNIALIIAGGKGVRMQQEVPKQFLTVNEKPVIAYTLEAFQRHADIDAIAVVCIAGWESILSAYAREYGISKLRHIIPGGDCGQASIRNGVFELEKHYGRDDLVLVHDAIRPMVSAEIISDCIATATQHGSAIAVIPCQEAMLVTGDQLSTNSSFPRANLRRTQTPQGFPIGTLADAHREALEKGITKSIASCTLMVELGRTIFFSHGSEKNLKLTTPEDIDIFKALLAVRDVQGRCP
ncbi:MAG: 2-C-methyl-D-erythritol 4-phosphate cytidylyltransferase [Clostridia bacterium]|nr:2-C-methyl-D-erythritol 4-phosphate cytidylyltransferase [Clostridia bacterium]